jgi:putative membrane protein
MRWLYLAVIAWFAVATLVFALQNFEIATVSFLGFRLRALLALLTIVVYILGGATGGSLLALLRRFYGRSRQSIMRASWETGRNSAIFSASAPQIPTP